MIRYLPFLIELGLLVFCLIDCIQTDVPREPLQDDLGVRHHHRCRSSAASRGSSPGARSAAGAERAVAVDADRRLPRVRAAAPLEPRRRPEFLAGMSRSDQTHEQMLKDWEAQLASGRRSSRRRTNRLRTGRAASAASRTRLRGLEAAQVRDAERRGLPRPHAK